MSENEKPGSCSFGTISILQGRAELDLDIVAGFAHVKDDEILMVGGTLIEGIGNFSSDIDCYAIVKERPRFGNLPFSHVLGQQRDMTYCIDPEDELFLSLDYYPGSRMHSEVEYWTFEEIAGLVDELGAEHQDALGHTKFLSYSRIKGLKHDFLHRSRFARVLQGGERLAGLLPLDTILPRLSYLLSRSTANFYWQFKDIIGAVHIGDPDLCYETTREYLVAQIQGYLYLSGFSNGRKRWIHTYIDQLGPDHHDIARQFKEILFRGAPSDEDKMRYVADAVALCDEIWRRERDMLDANDAYLSCDRALELLDKERAARSDHPSEILDEEFAYRRRIYGRDARPLVEMLEL